LNKTRLYPLLSAALLLAPVLVSAKTEISWAQYMQGMHFMQYHGVYNGEDAPDLACRRGGIFHSSRYYSGHNGYSNVPAPNPQRQDYAWKTPAASKSRTIVALTTSGKKAIYTLSSPTPDVSKCVVDATAGGDPGPGPLHGPGRFNRFYRLGPCQGVGHRGTAYEVWDQARTHIYCVDHQYMLYSFNLDDKGYWRKNAGPGSALAKEDPKLAALMTRMLSHPRQKQDTPWMYGGGPSTFTALTQIGGVHIRVPPSGIHGNCRTIGDGAGGSLTICKY
jgi:hypothetical protein